MSCIYNRQPDCITMLCKTPCRVKQYFLLRTLFCGILHSVEPPVLQSITFCRTFGSVEHYEHYVLYRIMFVRTLCSVEHYSPQNTMMCRTLFSVETFGLRRIDTDDSRIKGPRLKIMIFLLLVFCRGQYKNCGASIGILAPYTIK